MRPQLLSVCLLLTIAAAPETSIEQKSEQLLDDWKPRLQEEKLRHVVAPPFILAGDGSTRQLERYRDGTVLAAARALRATYFQTPPREPIVIFLFESEGPYKRLAKKWFNDEDVPHFGFYRHTDRVMFMNVATGTGTLVHELTHALIAPDFPTVPNWFNEGLASLYEQSSIDGDSIRGLVNWRLPALQKAIQKNTLRPLKEMMEDPRFYREDLVGLNYAEARYLMLYLQERKLLREYYRTFRDNAADDKNGIKSLEKVIVPQNFDEFEGRWREWVSGLKAE